jgi:hypothetical protein
MAKASKKVEVSAPEWYEEALSSPEQLQEDIKLTAYYLWESKGKPNGSDEEDWIKAEELVND